MKTAAIYARYSSDNQTEQSIEGQLRVCEEYAQRNGIAVTDTYIDRAMTGTNDNRPEFQRMIKDSAEKRWEVILVYKLDRFSRNKYETAIHKKTLKDNGVKVVSAMENIPDTPEGIILESLLEGMNQYYSAECFYGHNLKSPDPIPPVNHICKRIFQKNSRSDKTEQLFAICRACS